MKNTDVVGCDWFLKIHGCFYVTSVVVLADQIMMENFSFQVFCEVECRYLSCCSNGILHTHIAQMDSTHAESEVSVCIGRYSKAKK